MTRAGLIRRAARTATLALAAAALAAAFALAAGETEGPRLETVANGAMSQSNSHDGEAILHADNLAPGGSTSGTVRIGNTGSTIGNLGFSVLDDGSSGRSDAQLGSALELVMTEIANGEEVPIYRGPLEVVSSLNLEATPPGEERTFRLRVLLPDRGVPGSNKSEDNILQGANTDFSFEWELSSSAADLCGNVLEGSPGRDVISGTAEADLIKSGGGRDRIAGSDGDDCLHAGSGDDDVEGDSGADELSGAGGADVLEGGPGSDTIHAEAGGIDVVDCGGGSDVAFVGPRDHVTDC